MRPTFRGTIIGLALVAGAIVACSDSSAGPTEALASEVAFDQVPKAKAKGLLTALVRSDGTLAGGNAVASERHHAGTYLVSFGMPLAGCAGVVTAGSFPGADFSAAGLTTTLDLEFVGEGVVTVLLDGPSGDSSDSSFMLVLVCA